MGHMIQCFIGYPALLEEIVLPLKPIEVVTAELPQGLQCLFLCDKLFRSIHQYEYTDDVSCMEPFDFFTQAIKNYLEEIKPSGAFIYLETDYFGGEGTQSSGFFANGKLLEADQESTSDVDVTLPFLDRLLVSPINKALRRLGVVREATCDEFDALGLEEYRHMPDAEI